MNFNKDSTTTVPKTAGSLKRKRDDAVPPESLKTIRIVPGNRETSHSERNPQESLIAMLQEQGHEAKTMASESLSDFFEEVTEKEIEAYDAEALRAIRNEDLDTLKTFLQIQRPLKCSNRFGESLLHLACRKGLVSVVKFLVDEADVPLNVRDDMGRSPLHDAFWCPEANFDLVDVILKKCPDLLLISDKRGHPPLSYARRNHWKSWNEYLQSRSDMMKTIHLGSTNYTRIKVN